MSNANDIIFDISAIDYFDREQRTVFRYPLLEGETFDRALEAAWAFAEAWVDDQDLAYDSIQVEG
jgi:type II secretory pathway predicted ATPase ExeA